MPLYVTTGPAHGLYRAPLSSGTAAPFTPTDIATLRLWLAADSGVYQDSARSTPATANGDPVGGWTDRSGQNNHAVQATAAKRMLLQLTTNGINNRAVLLSDAVDDWIATAAFGATLSQPNTIFTVITLPASGQKFWLDGIVVGNRHALFQENPRVWQLYAGSLITGGTSDGSPHVVMGLFNGASSRLCIDGSAFSTTGDPGANTLTGLTMGSQYNAATPFGGKLGEVLLYNAALSNAQANQVGSYLAARWGTTWVAL